MYSRLDKRRDRVLDSDWVQLDDILVAAARQKRPSGADPIPQQNVEGEGGAAELVQKDVGEGGHEKLLHVLALVEV